MATNAALRRSFDNLTGRGSAEPLTVQHVLSHTAGLFALFAAAAAVGWMLVPTVGMGILAAGLVALALSVAVSARSVASPPLVLLFAVAEGLAVGGVSRLYEFTYDGIVVQALLGTAAVFLAMLGAYRMRWVRATPRLRRVVFVGLLSVVVLSLVDVVLRLLTGSHLPLLNDAGPVGIAISVAILVLAALQVVCDFDYIERAVAAGIDKREAWRAGFGLLVSFVWVYLEALRLLSKIRAR